MRTPVLANEPAGSGVVNEHPAVPPDIATFPRESLVLEFLA